MFDICEEMPIAKPGDIPILGFSDIDGQDRELPLPGLITLAAGESFSEGFILPVSPRSSGGAVVFTVGGCTEKAIHFDSIELLAEPFRVLDHRIRLLQPRCAVP